MPHNMPDNQNIRKVSPTESLMSTDPMHPRPFDTCQRISSHDATAWHEHVCPNPVALKISHAAGTATGSRCTRYPKCSIRRTSRSTVRRWAKCVPLNLSQFVAHKIWRRCGVSPRCGRAYHLHRRASLRGILVPIATIFGLLQTAIN